MRKKILLMAALAVVATCFTGCANYERKLGRGISNTTEILRLGEWRRTKEQMALFDSPEAAYTTGNIRGLNRTLARTGVGIYEIVTAPFPPYDPVLTDYLAPGPVYPDSYKPTLKSDSIYATDANLGFSGGDVLPSIPGSRFRIFETH